MLESVPTCIWLTRSKCLKYFGRSKTKYSLVAEIGSTWTNDPNHFSELNNLTKFGKKLSKPFIIISLAVLSWLSKIVDGVSLKRKTLSKLTNQITTSGWNGELTTLVHRCQQVWWWFLKIWWCLEIIVFIFSQMLIYFPDEIFV